MYHYTWYVTHTHFHCWLDYTFVAHLHTWLRINNIYYHNCTSHVRRYTVAISFHLIHQYWVHYWYTGTSCTVHRDIRDTRVIPMHAILWHTWYTTLISLPRTPSTETHWYITIVYLLPSYTTVLFICDSFIVATAMSLSLRSLLFIVLLFVLYHSTLWSIKKCQ